MKRRGWIGWLLLAAALSACSAKVQAPNSVGPASPESVALSLSTVDAEQSLALFEYDQAAPLDIQEERRWQEDGSVWIDFSYASPKGGRVPARLVIPKGAGLFPGIILQHGGPGILEEMDSFAREFSRYGAVTIMITSPYRRPGGWEITPYMGNTWPLFTERDLEIKIQHIIDLRRAVDILEIQPEVNPKRLAFFGVSWGGSMGGLLAGIEDRLKAYVLVVGDGGLVEHTGDPGLDGLNQHFSERWAAQMWPTEPLHFIGRAAPAALLFQNGLYDTFVAPHDALRFYAAANQPKAILWYEAGHSLPWSFVSDAANWLQPYLGDHLLLLAPNYRQTAMLADRALLAAILLPLGIFLGYIIRRKTFFWIEEWFWLAGILLLGPIGLGLYWLLVVSRDVQVRYAWFPRWRSSLLNATRTTIALMCGVWIGERINEILLLGDVRVRFVQFYLAVLLVGGVLSMIGKRRWWTSLQAHVLVSNLFWALVVALQALFWDYLPGLLLARYPVTTALGILITAPLHRWLLHNGWEMGAGADDLRKIKRDQSKALLAVLLVCSFVATLASVVLIVYLYSGLPLGSTVMMLLSLSP